MKGLGLAVAGGYVVAVPFGPPQDLVVWPIVTLALWWILATVRRSPRR